MKLPKMRIREECKKLFKMGKYAKKRRGEVTRKGGMGNFLKRKIDLQNIAKKII